MQSLIDRLSKLDAPDREVDAEICILFQYGGHNSEGATNVRTDPEWGDDDLLYELDGEPCCAQIPKLTASVDAAISLAERVLPESVARRLIVFNSSPAKAGFDGIPERGKLFYFEAATPAIAACIAILHAKEASNAE